MSKKILITLLLCCSVLGNLFAQENPTAPKNEVQQDTLLFDAIIESTLKGKRFKFYGDTKLTFNQAYFSNWISGGMSSLSGLFGVNYHIDYSDRTGLAWDTNIILSVGFTEIPDLNITRKTDDRFEIESIVGKPMLGHWKFAGTVKLKTQLFEGFQMFAEQGDTRRLTTDRFSPVLLQTGIGFYYKKQDNFWLNITPASARFIFIDKKFTTDIADNTTYLGVEKGKGSAFFLGFALTGLYRTKLMDNISMVNRFNIYSNYLREFANVDFEINTSIRFKVNNAISSNIVFHAIYDHDIVQKLQFRELFGMGIQIDI